MAPINHSSSQLTRLNYLSYGIKIWTDLSSVLSQITRLTDGQTEFSSLDRVCIPCSAVKIILVSGEVKFIRLFAGDHPSEGVKVKHAPIASENLTNIGHNLETVVS